ncbi:MAG: FeoB-associated Cys-rich membrane protein [Oscillospiraceae bacterium]|nr:FeoB-associated Cys-rich membrane protein [Oscillospiraceae bacterium]
MSTILVLLGVLLLAARAAYVLRRDRKQGKSSCGGNCASCGACHRCAENVKGKQAG